MEAGFTGELLQDEIFQLLIDNMTQPIMNNMPVVALGALC